MRLLWFVSTLEDTLFLKEFREHCEQPIDAFNINYITRFDLRSHSGIQLLPKFKSSFCDILVKDDLTTVFNVLSGRLTQEEAGKAYQATIGQLKEYLSKIESEDVVFVIPSGRHVHHVAATALAKEYNIARIYINYSNFPGYTFFDPEGTDCQASIYSNPSLLDEFFGDEGADIDATFKQFAELKHQQKSIPQKVNGGVVAKVKKVAFIFDTILQHVTGTVADRRIRFSLPNKQGVIEEIDYQKLDVSMPFLFFPLQVSTDQQVLVNYSGGSIFKAIDEAYDYAKSCNLPIYIREHPAEGKKNAVRSYLKKLMVNSDFIVTDASVSELITGCEEVVTINSTVGLESRLNRKPVRFLGKSFYAKASDQQLAYYLKYYFVPVDYHSPKLNNELVLKILGFV